MGIRLFVMLQRVFLCGRGPQAKAAVGWLRFRCRTGNRRFSQPARSMRRHLFKQRLVAEQPFHAEFHPPLRFPDDVFPIFAGGSQALRSAASDGNRAPLPDAGRRFRPGLRGPVPMGKPMRALAKAKASNGESTIGSSSSEAIGAVSVFAAILGKPAGAYGVPHSTMSPGR